jgi:hypothetical protein
VALVLTWTLSAGAQPLGAAADTPFEPAAPDRQFAESSGQPSVTIGLQAVRASSLRPTLALRGHSIGREEPEAFKVETDLSQVPCPGEYHFETAEEDSKNGNSSTYDALIRLFDPAAHPANARCGGPLPPLRGHMNVLLQDRVNRLFAIKGARSNGGAFEGRLTLSGLPQCGRSYTLEADADLAGWSRSLEFKVQVIEINTTLQGKPAQSDRC